MAASRTAQFRTELTPEELRAWEERGFHIHEPLFSPAEVAAIRDACQEVTQERYETACPPDVVHWRPGDDPLAVIKLDNCWKANRCIAEAVTSPRLGQIAAQLVGASEIRLWHDQYLHKPPRGGRVVTWHQDWAYWQMIAECRTCTCWIALTDVSTLEQGPMVYLEGSHTLGLHELPPDISGEDERKPRLPEGMSLREVPVFVRAGQVAFHHGLTLHGSGINQSDAPREALVSHVMAGDCTYRPGQHHMNEDKMHEQSGGPQPGQTFRGPQFPHMWPIAM